MQKPKKKINVKKFLEDFRSGKTEEELMRLHEISRQNLEKVFQILVEKRLLSKSEVPRPAQTTPSKKNYPHEDAFTAFEAATPGVLERTSRANVNQCPQCGATVNKRSLTCPECGHVLRGEDRWEHVDPGKKLLERIPPKVLGCILALPVAIGFYFLFKDIILPMAESAVAKRADQVRKEVPRGSTPMKMAKQMAAVGSQNVINLEIERLKAEEIISSVSQDYTAFVAGPRWNDLVHEEKLARLTGIRSALKDSGIKNSFLLVNERGDTLARVEPRSIELADERIIGQMPERASPPHLESLPEPVREPGAMDRAMHRKVPAGLDRILPHRQDY